MADEADMTAERDERDEREAPMRIAASRKPTPPAPDGRCMSCGASVPETHRYCDADCRHDFERAERMQQIGGVS